MVIQKAAVDDQGQVVHIHKAIGHCRQENEERHPPDNVWQPSVPFGGFLGLAPLLGRHWAKIQTPFHQVLATVGIARSKEISCSEKYQPVRSNLEAEKNVNLIRILSP